MGNPLRLEKETVLVKLVFVNPVEDVLLPEKSDIIQFLQEIMYLQSLHNIFQQNRRGVQKNNVNLHPIFHKENRARTRVLKHPRSGG